MPDASPTPFTQFLLQIRGGDLHHELTEALAELSDAVRETGRAGALTIQVKVKQANKGGNAVLVTATHAVKAPAAPAAEALFFVAEGGAISRSDPRQPELPLRDASGPTPIRSATQEAN